MKFENVGRHTRENWKRKESFDMSNKLSDLLKNTIIPVEKEPVDPMIPAADAVRNFDTSILKKQVYKEIDPSRCRPWLYHNRHSFWFTKERCGSLIESIQREGQQELGLVRPIKDDPHFDFEIIYGVRRWYSCSQIEGRKFKARVTDASDAECAKLMHFENEESKDITEFEKACAFMQQLKGGIFQSKKELADSLNISQSLVTRFCKAASIMDYAVIAALLNDYVLDISILKASKLGEELQDLLKRKKIEAKAQELIDQKTEKTSALKLIDALLSSVKLPEPVLQEISFFPYQGKNLVIAKKTLKGKIEIVVDQKFKSVKGKEAAKELSSVFNRIVEDMV